MGKALPAPLPFWVAAPCVEGIPLSVEHVCVWWCLTPGQSGESRPGDLFLQMSEDLFDHYRVFDGGNDLGGAAAFTAGLDVDI